VSWFQRKAEKPAGIYNASAPEYACANCAYRDANVCRIHRFKIEQPTKKKCGDFLRADQSVPEFREAES
jgi:hypothetical protein